MYFLQGSTVRFHHPAGVFLWGVCAPRAYVGSLQLPPTAHSHVVSGVRLI